MPLPPDTLIHYAILIAAGVAAGFVNTIAGGGSMLTVPALMLLGLPANVANGTNRLSVVATSLSGLGGFHREGKLPTRAVFAVAAPTALGGVLGAGAAAVAPVWLLEPVLLATMMTVALVTLVRPRFVMAKEDETPREPLRHAPSFMGLFFAGLYGGFVQAGVGFVLLAVLGGILRYDAPRANALKLACSLAFGLLALGVFVAADQVVWGPAIALAAATVVGAQLGVRFAVKVPAAVLRWILFVAVVATCAAAFLKGQ